MLNRAGAAGAFAACASSVAFDVWADCALRLIRYQSSNYRKRNQDQKRKTALIAVVFILPRATRVAQEHVELLMSKDEDFSLQSAHHRNSSTVATLLRGEGLAALTPGKRSTCSAVSAEFETTLR